MAKTQSAFTIIELLIVSAIISILATLALPLYNQYTIVSTAGSNMKGINSFTMKALTCQQTNIGCLSLLSEMTTTPELSITPSPAPDISMTLYWQDKSDRCIITAQINQDGIISYQAASAGNGTDNLCEKGAGLQL